MEVVVKIFILQSLKKITEKKYIITKYISNVNLINQKKYDLRLYVLITGLKPLRIYLYKEGLVRIASKNYTLNPLSLKNKYIHLTNTAINIHHKNFIFPKNFSDITANILSLKAYEKYLKENNANYNNINQKIKDLIIKAIISLQDKIINKNEELNLDDRNLFNLFGFDILITDELKPILLEVNTNPDMNLYTNVEKIIKTNLFIDTLNIIGIVPFSRTEKFDSFFKYKNKNNFEEIIQNAFCELSRPK